MPLKKYNMENQEGPKFDGRYRLGPSIYQPAIKTTSEGYSLLIEEWRHPSDPGVPILGIKIKGIVIGQEGNTCLFDEKTFSKEEAIAFAREFPEYNHLLPRRSLKLRNANTLIFKQAPSPLLSPWRIQRD